MQNYEISQERCPLLGTVLKKTALIIALILFMDAVMCIPAVAKSVDIVKGETDVCRETNHVSTKASEKVELECVSEVEDDVLILVEKTTTQSTSTAIASSTTSTTTSTKDYTKTTVKTTKTTNTPTMSVTNSSNDVCERIWNIMTKEFGWSDVVAAGIMANIYAESGFNVSSCGAYSYGFCQWMGGRRQLLLSKYGSHPTAEQQMQFIRDELYGNGMKAQVNEYQRNLILNATTPYDAGYYFCVYFERPSNSNSRGQYRGNLAVQFYEKYA